METLAIILGIIIGLPITFYVRKGFTFAWRNLNSTAHVIEYDVTQTGFAKMFRAGLFYFFGIMAFISIFMVLFGV